MSYLPQMTYRVVGGTIHATHDTLIISFEEDGKGAGGVDSSQKGPSRPALPSSAHCEYYCLEELG